MKNSLHIEQGIVDGAGYGAVCCRPEGSSESPVVVRWAFVAAVTLLATFTASGANTTTSFSGDLVQPACTIADQEFWAPRTIDSSTCGEAGSGDERTRRRTGQRTTCAREGS